MAPPRNGCDARSIVNRLLRFASVTVAVSCVLVEPAGSDAAPAPLVLPPSFQQIDQGPAGGTVWQGLIPNREVPAARRLTVVYLPPAAVAGRRYAVAYLLHGFRGSPYEYAFGLHLAEVADREIEAGSVRPFIAVAPPAGATGRFHGEWSGPWEDYVVDDVVAWVDSHLPTEQSRRGRVIAGLSAGGYGAVDIGLRHPDVFGTLESWSGYFTPIRDGSLVHAGPSELAAHDPLRLVQVEGRQLVRLGTRFFLSSGTTRDRTSAAAAIAFARELASWRLTHELVLRPGGHDGVFWRAQLPAALGFAFGGNGLVRPINRLDDAPPGARRLQLGQRTGR
jgi:enterochelin esterase-like enzyme